MKLKAARERMLTTDWTAAAAAAAEVTPAAFSYNSFLTELRGR